MSMISCILRWLVGWVRVEAEGGFSERLLNALTSDHIGVWDVCYREESVCFSCRAKEYRSLWPLARCAQVRMRVRHKHGLPFLCYRYRKRKGLWIGLALYILVLALLAPRIWVIEVIGNTTTSTEKILEIAAQQGVVIGARMDRVNVKGLQIGGTQDVPTLSFISVNPSHCVARIEVSEREQSPPPLDLSHPSDMVALRDGRILQMDVYSGSALVRVGEAVSAGTRLITGRVASDVGEKLYRSYGEVWAETRRNITVSVPLQYEYTEPTGELICRPTFTFLCWDFPLYSNVPLQGESRQKQVFHRLAIDGITLPLGISTTYWLPVATHTATRTAQQAEALAVAELAEKEAALFLPDSYELLSKESGVEDGCYVLRAAYLCRENIAVEVPLDADLPTSVIP